MADTVVASTANVSMVDYPLVMQAADGDTALEYAAQDFRIMYDGLFKAEGVINGSDFKVTQNGAGANFSVDVAAGFGVIQGDGVVNQGKYMVRSTGVVNLTTPGAPASGTRQHRVIARIRDKLMAGPAFYDWTLELLEDTGSGTPPLPASAIPIARVTIAAGQSNVGNANITDDRLRAQIGDDSNNHARYYQTVQQAIPHGATTRLQFDASVSTTPDVTPFNTNSVFGLFRPGIWLLEASVSFSVQSGNTYRTIQIANNDGSARYAEQSVYNNGAGMNLTATAVRRFGTGGPQVAVWAYQESGVTVNTNPFSETIHLTMTWLGA